LLADRLLGAEGGLELEEAGGGVGSCRTTGAGAGGAVDIEAEAAAAVAVEGPRVLLSARSPAQVNANATNAPTNNKTVRRSRGGRAVLPAPAVACARGCCAGSADGAATGVLCVTVCSVELSGAAGIGAVDAVGSVGAISGTAQIGSAAGVGAGADIDTGAGSLSFGGDGIA